MDTRKSDAFHRFGHCVRWVLGAAEAGSTEACQKDQCWHGSLNYTVYFI